MGQNTDTLKQGYEKFGQGDIQGAMENWHDDIRWEGSESTRIPGNGVHEGKQAIAGSLQETVQAYDSFSVTPDEFIEDGDTVVVLSHAEAKGKDTGKEVKLPFVHVWRFSDGKATEVQALTDTALAADALGNL
jgi:ketosteroid isomerase-like protein